MDDNELVEKLADLEHKRWSNWQTWCHKILREHCPSEAMEKVLARWDKQIAMDYKDLSEREKEMDREEAKKTLEVLSRYEAIEPLAVLADRKGYWKTRFTTACDAMAKNYWTCEIEKESFDTRVDNQRIFDFIGKTYAETEQNARAFLETLPDNATKDLK